MLENFLLSAHTDSNAATPQQEAVYCFVNDTHRAGDLFFQDCMLSDVTEMLNRLVLHETALEADQKEGQSFGDVRLMLSLSNLITRLKENRDAVNKEITCTVEAVEA